MATSSSSSGLTFKLHPLVVVNISDHVTRAKVASEGSEASSLAVGGCLLGSLAGGGARTVDVANSFELVLPSASSPPDEAHLRRRIEQYKQTFPSLDPVGWYAVGPLSSPPVPGSVAETIHSAFSSWMTAAAAADSSATATAAAGGGGEAGAVAPFGLVFDPSALLEGGKGDPATPAVRTSVAGLPMRLWEWAPGGGAGGGGEASAAAAGAAGGKERSSVVGSWAEAPFTIDSSEIERIGVAQAARAVPAGADESGTDQLVAHYKALHSAVSTMASRIEEIRAAVSEMAEGKREVDRGAVRAAAALLSSAGGIGGGEASSSSAAAAAASAEADALSMLLLASATRGISASAALVEAVQAGAPRVLQENGNAAATATAAAGGGAARQQRQARQQQHRGLERGGAGGGRRRGSEMMMS